MDEELLSVWLRLTSVIDNQRLAAAHTSPSGKGPLPFNEAVVCGLLARAQGTGSVLTASDLCRHTRILKSQMNAILRSLEDKGAVERLTRRQTGGGLSFVSCRRGWRSIKRATGMYSGW